MTTKESSRAMYEIAYDKTRQSIIVYPQYRGTRPNHHVIGTFQPENAHDDFENYREELSEAVVNAMARVGELDMDAWSIRITMLNGDPDYQAKKATEPLKRVPLEDQVAVGSGRTAAEQATLESENGEAQPHASQLTQDQAQKGATSADAEPTKLDEKPPASSKKAKDGDKTGE